MSFCLGKIAQQYRKSWRSNILQAIYKFIRFKFATSTENIDNISIKIIIWHIFIVLDENL